MHAIGLERGTPALRELNRRQDIRGLGTVVPLSDVVSLHAGMLDGLKVHTVAERVRGAADEYHAWDVRGTAASEQLGEEELGEEEVPDVVDGDLALEAVDGELEGTEERGGVVHEYLEPSSLLREIGGWCER